VFREVVRDRILYIIGFYGIFAAAIRLLPEVARLKIKSSWTLPRSDEFTGLIVAVFVGTGLVNKEIEKRTVLVLIQAHQPRRVTGKHLGLSAVLALLVAAMTAIYLALCTFENSLPVG